MKEHQDACKRGNEKVSAIAEHAWEQHHPIKWEEVRVVDKASKNRELKIKEALHIQMTPDNNKFNRGIVWWYIPPLSLLRTHTHYFLTHHLHFIRIRHHAHHSRHFCLRLTTTHCTCFTSCLYNGWLSMRPFSCTHARSC